MTKSDKPRLARVLAVLAETFNEPVSDVRAEGYYMALADLQIVDIESAAKDALRSCKFFPRPAELRDLAIGSPTDSAELAWLNVQKAVRRVGYYSLPNLDAATMRAIEAVWGGWQELCSKLPNDGPELLGWAKRFQSAYCVMQRRSLPFDAPQLEGMDPSRFLSDGSDDEG